MPGAVAEPTVSGAVADRIVEKLAFDYSYRVEAQDEGKDSAWLFTVEAFLSTKVIQIYMGSEGWKRSNSSSQVGDYVPPKVDGGLGLRRMETMNKAFIMKLAWGIIQDSRSMWVRVLKAKYMKHLDQVDQVHAKGKDSSSDAAGWIPPSLSKHGAVAHKAVLTNEVRWRRKITGNPYCSHCLIEVETGIHVLRDCPKARMVREVLVKVEERDYFFSPNWYTWLLRNPMMVFTGLELAWSKGYRKLDSAVVIDLITKDKINIDRDYCLIMKARNLLAKEEFQTTHVYREANFVAD
ncbi:hypothetical protein NC652_019353 [Populus alba x Populus x berolinensis]|nr:hypothetical protein NC652_019353 [Populus alba x Populus x berolinensis]